MFAMDAEHFLDQHHSTKRPRQCKKKDIGLQKRIFTDNGIISVMGASGMFINMRHDISGHTSDEGRLLAETLRIYSLEEFLQNLTKYDPTVSVRSSPRANVQSFADYKPVDQWSEEVIDKCAGLARKTHVFDFHVRVNQSNRNITEDCYPSSSSGINETDVTSLTDVMNTIWEDYDPDVHGTSACKELHDRFSLDLNQGGAGDTIDCSHRRFLITRKFYIQESRSAKGEIVKSIAHFCFSIMADLDYEVFSEKSFLNLFGAEGNRKAILEGVFAVNILNRIAHFLSHKVQRLQSMSFLHLLCMEKSELDQIRKTCLVPMTPSQFLDTFKDMTTSNPRYSHDLLGVFNDVPFCEADKQ